MNDHDSETYRRWLVAGLAKPGKTQRGLAHVLGIDPMEVSRLVHGTRKFQVGELRKIAAYINEQIPEIGRMLSMPIALDGVHVMGRIAVNVWQDGESDIGTIAGSVSV